MQQQGVKCNFADSIPWVILSPIEQSIKQKIESVGIPLKDWNIQINYGIKTGFNDAFIISTEKRDEILANCQTEDERVRTAELIRPILRGRDIKRYEYEWADLWIIATFPSRHYDIESYPAVKNYLLSIGIERLEQTGETHIVNGKKIKARKKTSNEWFETQDSISYWDVYNSPLKDWQVQSLNSICFLENILIFRYVPDDEAKEIIYMEREAKTYRKIDKDRPFPLCPLPLMPEEVLRIMTIRALKLFRNDTNIWFDVENLRITLSKGLDNSYLYFNEQTNEFDIWFEDSFMRYVGGIEWNTPNNPYTTMFVNQWFKTGTKIVLDELFEGFSANGLDIRYNANVGLGLHIIIKLN